VTHCRQVMLEELQRRNFAPTTISSYLHAVEQFARHFKCRPDRLNQTHFRSYQLRRFGYSVRDRAGRLASGTTHSSTRLSSGSVETVSICLCGRDVLWVPSRRVGVRRQIGVWTKPLARRTLRISLARSAG
jgi:hypothetical protein